MKVLDVLVTILLVVGGLNWGLEGVAHYNLVTTIFGAGSVANIVYILVGLAAIYQIFQWKAMHRRWSCK